MPRDGKHLKDHQFKKGQSGNPNGRPLLPIRGLLQQVTKKVLRKVIKEALSGNIDNLVKLANSREVSAMEATFAKCLATAWQKGDYNTFEKMLERIVGKIPDILKVEGRHAIVVYTVEQRRKAIEEFEASL